MIQQAHQERIISPLALSLPVPKTGSKGEHIYEHLLLRVTHGSIPIIPIYTADTVIGTDGIPGITGQDGLTMSGNKAGSP